ncbi:MAG: hypothetical protein M1832_000485 [Thelocarpon impressellum]|nr:MAG: hypothetical protein M1832_000485 [Thelocarpon impressellum]
MDHRYRRPGSPPGGRLMMNNVQRSSTGTLYPAYDPYYPPSRIPRDTPASPRQSGERLVYPDRPLQRAYADEIQPSPTVRGGYGRPRRATLDPEEARRPVIQPPGPALASAMRPVVHGGGMVDSPTSPSAARRHNTYSRGEYYITPASSNHRHHRGHHSMDHQDGAMYTRQIDGPVETRERPGERGDYRASGVERAQRRYHLSGPLVRHPDVDGGRYGYDAYGGYGYGDTDPNGDLYRDPAPARARGESLDASRRERPLSMVELGNYLPRSTSVRERGPPPSTRGFNAPGVRPRSGSADRRPQFADGYVPASRESKPVVVPGARAPQPKPAVLHHDRGGGLPPYPDDGARPRDRERDRARHERRYEDDDTAESSSESDGRAHRHRRSSRPHRDSTIEAVAAGVGAAGVGAAGVGANRERDGRDKPPPREERAKEVREVESRGKEREPRRPDGYDKDTDRDARHRDALEREARKREFREKHPHDRENHEKEHRGSGAGVVDLRGREPKEREKSRDDGGDGGGERSNHVRVVSPPREKESKAPVKSILREPREKFPEDPTHIREGVAPLKEALKDGKKGIPPGARWTKVDRKLVNPAALEEAHERYEERADHVIVLRVLTREEIEKLAARTQEIRGMRIANHADSEKADIL